MQITLTPEEIINVANQLKAQAENIEDARISADSQVGTIRDMQSPRLQQDIEMWDSLKAEIEKAVSALRDAAEELNQLAEANIIANQPRG